MEISPIDTFSLARFEIICAIAAQSMAAHPANVNLKADGD
jgi:hypothetical protein